MYRDGGSMSKVGAHPTILHLFITRGVFPKDVIQVSYSAFY